MRFRYENAPDLERLLGDTLTILELRKLHEVIAGEDLDRDMFGRGMRECSSPPERYLGVRGVDR